jgi:predicted RNA-binding protein with PUA-like domain
MRHWLMKSEPSECSIDDLAAAPRQTVPWVGVRNYQARNFMRDEMQVGDGVLFYHSSCPEPGIAGLAQITSAAYPDATQFDPQGPYADPRSTPAAPRWLNVDVALVRKTRLLSLAEMRGAPSLTSLVVLKRGNRLSITPVSADEWRAVLALLKQRE